MFEELTLSRRERWDQFLSCFSGLDVFYRAGYGRILEVAGCGQACLFVWETRDNLAVYPFLLREVPATQDAISRYDIASPYGYSGPVFVCPPRRAEILSFLQAFHEYCREKGIIAEFIRFHPLTGNHRYFLLDLNVKKAGMVINVDLTKSPDEIWRGYAHNNRKNINKAARSGLETVFDQEGRYFEEFYQLYLATMTRNRAASFYYFSREFFYLLHRELAGSFLYLHVFKDNQMISTELVLFSQDYLHSFLGGTNPEYFPWRPNNLLKHRLISWAAERGFKNYLLGGGYRPGDGIYHYKASFATRGAISFYTGRQVHDVHAYAGLCREQDYFPAYRRSR